MQKAGVEWVVMEVSSHALELHRVDDCAFDQALFTNLTEDHFDFHGNFENYYKAKKRLFTLLAHSPKSGRFAVVNIDDAYGNRLAREIRGVPCYAVSVKRQSHYRAKRISLGVNATSFSVNGLEVETGLSGQFNVYNTLGAYAWASEMRLKKMLVLQTLARFRSVEGRFEVFSAENRPSVVVDYAHTEDALENVLKTVSEICKGRIITVFGCGGNRDKLKRPKMGEVADRLSDIVIVTSDNPRKEDPKAIITDILRGIRRKKGLHIEVDRLKAIRKAFALAKRDDVILVAGKGHEDYQIFKDRTIHFSDREIVGRILGRRSA
jgi:UDP-N-acetylmuramyl-tripeptide synthetase